MRLDAPESPLGDVVFSTASSSSPHSVASSSSSRPLGVTSLLKGAMESDHEEGELLMQSETIPPRAFVGTPSLHNTPSEQTSADHAGKTRRVSRPLQRILRRSGNSTGYRSRALTPIILAVLSACLVSLKLFYLACVRSTNMTLPASTSSSSSSLEFASRLLPRFRASPFSSGSDDAGSSIRRLADSQGGAPNQGMPRNSELCHTGEGSGEEGPEQRASGENLARNEESPVQPSTGRELRGQARQELGEQETDDTVPTQGGGSSPERDQNTMRGRKRKISVEHEDDADNGVDVDETSGSVLALTEMLMSSTKADPLNDPYAESNEEELQRLLIEPEDIPDAQHADTAMRMYFRLFDNALKRVYLHPWRSGNTTVSTLNSLLRLFAQVVFWSNKFEMLYPRWPTCQDAPLRARTFEVKKRVESLVRRTLRDLFGDRLVHFTPQLELQLLRTAVGASRGVHHPLPLDSPVQPVIRERDLADPFTSHFQHRRFDLRSRLEGRMIIKDFAGWLRRHPHISNLVKEDNLLKAAIRAQDTVDAVKPKGARARLSTTSRKQSDALHDVRLSVRSSARGDPDEALELPWTAGQLFIEDLPLSAAPPSSWALAISEQSELALSRLQMSRLRLKSVPTETSLEAVLAHIATSDLLLGRIASLREAYPELESHILVEQAKTRILQGLKQAWSSLHVGEASAQKLRIKLVDCVSRASADIRTKAASEFEGLGLQKMLDYLQKLAWEAGRQQGLVRLVSEWSLENDDFIDDSDVKMKNRSLMGFLKRFRRGTLRVSDVASIQPELQTDVRQLAPQSQADTATGAQHSTSSGSGSLLDVLLGTSASATAPGQEAFLPPHPPYPHVPPSYPHPQSPFAPSSSFHPPFGHSSAAPDPSGPASHATDYEDESGDDGVDTVSSAISHSLIDRLLDTLASPEAPEEVQESAGSMLDEGLLLDDVMAMIDEELGTVPGGSSPAHSVPSPPDEQHLLDELIPSLDPQDDTDQR